LHVAARNRPLLLQRILILLLLSETRRRPHGGPGQRGERNGRKAKR